MTKYWVLTMIGAVGLAALIHPHRLQFLRSPAPWVAIATLAVAMLPHFMWLKQVDFVPLTYAGIPTPDRPPQIDNLALGYVLHNLALLALPVVLGAIALAWRPWRWRRFGLARGANASVNMSRRSMSGSSRPWWRSGRRSARDVPRLHQDRLGHPAVLPDAAGADRDPRVAVGKSRC
jgi:hypothetical protein